MWPVHCTSQKSIVPLKVSECFPCISPVIIGLITHFVYNIILSPSYDSFSPIELRSILAFKFAFSEMFMPLTDLRWGD